jgi:hypothetical protein
MFRNDNFAMLCYAIMLNVSLCYHCNALMQDADDFWSCFKVLEINIFDNLVLSVHVTRNKTCLAKKKFENSF